MPQTKASLNRQIQAQGDFSMASFRITDLAAPSANGDAATKSYVDQYINGLRSKGTVRAMATASTGISGSAGTIDGVVITNGQYLLLTGQTTGSENGIWIVITAGAWARPANFITGSDAAGAYVVVQEGAVHADEVQLCTNNTGSAVVDTASLTWQEWPALIDPTVITEARIIVGGTPTGAINGANVTFVFASTPLLNSEAVYLNGQRQTKGASNDYTISGATVTMIVAPVTADILRVDYIID